MVAVTAPEELGDAQRMGDTLRVAREEVEAFGSGAQVREVVTDQGYHSNETVLELKELGLRGYLSETGSWPAELEGEEPEIPGAGLRQSETDPGPAGTTVASGSGASWWSGRSHTSSRRAGCVGSFVRGHANVRKRLLIHVCEFQPGTADAPT